MLFQYIPVASEFSNDEHINQIISGYVKSLNTLGGICTNADNIQTNAPLFYFAVTGGVERKVLDLVEQRNNDLEPVFIIAHPANNSLPASMEILAKLQQDGVKGEIFYLSSPSDKAGLTALKDAADNILLSKYLNDLRLGVIGKPSDWLVASAPDADLVKKTWGPELVNIPVEEVLSSLIEIPDADVKAAAKELMKRSSAISEPSEQDVLEAAKVLAALKNIIAKYKLDHLTIRCFDIVLQAKTTGCFALSSLTDEGIIAGCEGDIMSLLAMVWGEKLLKQTPWMANPSKIDTSENRLWLAHCTVPRTITREYKLRSHFESGLGVGIQGTIPEGPVTLLRIGGKNMDNIWIAEGKIIRNGNEDNMCRTQIEIQLERGGSLMDLLKKPLGNHIVLFSGKHLDRLTASHDKLLLA